MSYTTAFKTTAFNPASRSSGALLDGYDRELSGPTSPATGSYAVLGVNSIANTQKKYMEFTIGAASSAVALVGFGSTSLSGTTNLGANNLGVALDGATGDVVCNGAAIATPGITFTAGDVICMAIDRPNGTFWFRKNGGNWNGSGTADPVTNTGGITIPASLGTGNLYLAALAKVASSATSKVSMNVGHTAFAQTRPTGYLVWTGLTDSAYIQQIINAAVVDRTHIVVLPIARYDCRSQIVLPKGFMLQGSGRAKHSYPTGDLPDGESTVLDINWGSGASTNGDPTKVAVLLGAGAHIHNVAFNYPGQSPTSNPTEYGSTIAPNSAEVAWDQKVSDCFFQKAYVAIDLRGSEAGNQAIGSCVITGNRGAPIKVGIWLDYVTDWCTIADNQFNANWVDPFQGYRTLLIWIKANGAAYRADGCDWVTFERCDAFGYYHGVEIRGGVGNERVGPYAVINSDFDACQDCVVVYAEAYYAQPIRVQGCRFNPSNSYNNTLGFSLILTEVEGISVTYTDNYQFVSTAGVISALSSNIDWLNVTGNKAIGGTGADAIDVSGGTMVNTDNNDFVGFI